MGPLSHERAPCVGLVNISRQARPWRGKFHAGCRDECLRWASQMHLHFLDMHEKRRLRDSCRAKEYLRSSAPKYQARNAEV